MFQQRPSCVMRNQAARFAGWRLRLLAEQLLLDIGSGLLAGAHGQDDGCGTGHDVAASPDARIGGASVLIGLDKAPTVELDVGAKLCERVRARADGRDRNVAGNGELGVLDGDGATAAASGSPSSMR